MLRTIFVIFGVLCGARVICSSVPNIVFILADDMGWNDVGYHGSEISTPNMDRLAASGVKLGNYYVQPYCTPTRNALLTGRYNIHTGSQHGVLHPDQKGGMPLSSPTFADQIQAEGYSTHMIGKWHLGFYRDAYLPWNRGFDTFYGILTGDGDHYLHEQSVTFDNGTKVSGVDFRFNDDILTNETNNYSTDLYAARAVKVIEEHDSANGLMLYLSFQAVHAPLQAPQSYLDQYSSITDASRQKYAAMATCMDDAIASVETALKAKGIWDNSIIIFSSDNGGANGKGNNWPLRGEKGTLWEGGIRAVGFVASELLPAAVAGTTNTDLMHVTDWFPTMTNLAGGSLTGLSLDGYDQWSAIEGSEDGPRTELLHNIDELNVNGERTYRRTFNHRQQAALRVGDMKLLTGDPGNSEWYMVNGTSISLIEASSKNIWLFNITADPYEETDLSDLASMSATVLDMLDKLNGYDGGRIDAIDPDSDPNFYLPGGVYAPWDN